MPKAAPAALWSTRYAHRGLHDRENTLPENSLAAFAAAAEAGYGFELDINLTTDDQVVVFHDDDLKRAPLVEADVALVVGQEHDRQPAAPRDPVLEQGAADPLPPVVGIDCEAAEEERRAVTPRKVQPARATRPLQFLPFSLLPAMWHARFPRAPWDSGMHGTGL
jgi:glycerophosphoryl diester phosphodiesterase